MRVLHRLAQHARIGWLAKHEPLFHPFMQQGTGHVGIKVLVEQRDQPAYLRALQRGAVDHRIAIDRFLEEFADRLAVGKAGIARPIMEHGGAACGVEMPELVAPLPRMLTHQFIGDVLLAHQQAQLAAEGA